VKPLTTETIQAIAARTVELHQSEDIKQRIPSHHLIWVLERIAGVGDGYVPGEIQRLIDEQIGV